MTKRNREAEIVLDLWREVERRLESAQPGSHEAEALQSEAAALRDEYQRLVEIAREGEPTGLEQAT